MYRYLNILLKRQSQHAAANFSPLIENYKTMRNTIHFPGIHAVRQGPGISAGYGKCELRFQENGIKDSKTAEGKSQTWVHILNQYEQDFIQKVLSMIHFPPSWLWVWECVHWRKQMKQDPQMQEKIKSIWKVGCSYYQLEQWRASYMAWQRTVDCLLIMDLKQFSNLTVRCFVDSVLLNEAAHEKTT